MNRNTKEKLLKIFNNIALIGYPLFYLINIIHTKVFFRKKYKNGFSGMLRVRDEAEYIEQCVNSCIDSLDELITYDNGSTDGTYEKLLELAKSNPKIKVFQYNNHEGWYVKKLCKKTLKKTTYKYIVKIDGDQIYNKEYFEEAKQLFLNKTNSIVWLSGLNLFWDFQKNQLCFPNKITVGGSSRIFNGMMDTGIFRKTIFTMFLKHKINGDKYEFLYIPYMGSCARPYIHYDRLIWIHLRGIKYNTKLDNPIYLKDINKLTPSYFDIKDTFMVNYYSQFLLSKKIDGYYTKDSIIEDIHKWSQYYMNNIYKGK